MRQLYPAGGTPWFQTGHLAYIQAVTATLISRGISVSAMRFARQPFDPAAGPRAAQIELAPETSAANFPASKVPFTLTWNETYGWNYTIGDAANNGMSFGPGNDTVLRSRGLGPAVPLVADPNQVADAAAELLAGKQFEPVGWPGRDADIQDVTLESALATYRQHPGALALDGKHEQFVTSRDVLLNLDQDLLDGIAAQRGGVGAPALDTWAAQVSITAVRYEVSAQTPDSVNSREAAQHSAFVERADPASNQWVVRAGLQDVPVYLTAEGQETDQRQTYDRDAALQVAQQAVVRRRNAVSAPTPNELSDTRPGPVTPAHIQAAPARSASAWTRPVGQALNDHALRQGNPEATRPRDADDWQRSGHEAQR